MEFKNDTLVKMSERRVVFNSQFANWYMRYYFDIGGSFQWSEEARCNVPVPDVSPSLFNKSERIRSCMDFWLWDKYEQNKILDLQKVNRCMNSRFCPNCKMLDVSKFIHKFRSIFDEYIEQGYKFYMLTVTVPSCDIDGYTLKGNIERLSVSFNKFFKKFGYDDDKALDGRLITIFGGIKVLEITCHTDTGFHPHYHIVVLLKDEPEDYLLEKNILGKWSRKKGEYNKLSLIDLQLSKIWGMIWYGKRLTKKNIENYVVEPQEVYVKYFDEEIEDKVLQVDFRELDEAGIWEVFKYTFKSSDVENYDIFKALVDGLQFKRIRQGFGVLYNVKVNDDELEDGEEQALELAVPEDPQQLVTNEIMSLVNEYRDYKKISRFHAKCEDGISD